MQTNTNYSQPNLPLRAPLHVVQTADEQPPLGEIQDSFVPSTFGNVPPRVGQRPVMLAQASNPSMPYFPGGYNPTSATAPAQLLNQLMERSRHRLGRALNPHERQDMEMVFGLMQHGERSMGAS
jgi:hypothetical protein